MTDVIHETSRAVPVVSRADVVVVGGGLQRGDCGGAQRLSIFLARFRLIPRGFTGRVALKRER